MHLRHQREIHLLDTRFFLERFRQGKEGKRHWRMKRSALNFPDQEEKVGDFATSNVEGPKEASRHVLWRDWSSVLVRCTRWRHGRRIEMQMRVKAVPEVQLPGCPLVTSEFCLPPWSMSLRPDYARIRVVQSEWMSRVQTAGIEQMSFSRVYPSGCGHGHSKLCQFPRIKG